MEKPYRYAKKLIKSGNSSYVLLPKDWLEAVAKKLNVKEIKDVTLEVFKDSIRIIPGLDI